MCWYLNWHTNTSGILYHSVSDCCLFLFPIRFFSPSPQLLVLSESATSDFGKQHSSVSGENPQSKSPTRLHHRSNWLTARYVPVQDYIWCMSSLLEHAVLLADTSDRLDGAVYVWCCCCSVTLVLELSYYLLLYDCSAIWCCLCLLFKVELLAY